MMKLFFLVVAAAALLLIEFILGNVGISFHLPIYLVGFVYVVYGFPAAAATAAVSGVAADWVYGRTDCLSAPLLLIVLAVEMRCFVRLNRENYYPAALPGAAAGLTAALGDVVLAVAHGMTPRCNVLWLLLFSAAFGAMAMVLFLACFDVVSGVLGFPTYRDETHPQLDDDTPRRRVRRVRERTAKPGRSS